MNAKQAVGEEVVKYIKEGSVIGLGTGSTVYWTLKKIGELNLDIIGICTSVDTENKCKEFGIKTSTIDEHLPALAIDGADEVDADKHLIKGGGGALTREKIIDYRAKDFVVIVTENKISQTLGEKFALPIEVLPFGWKRLAKELAESWGFEEVVKRDFVTDNKNFILDCKIKIEDPKALEKQLNELPGVVENGLFTKPCKVLVGSEEGVREL